MKRGGLGPQLGRGLHPDKPYSDPRVSVHITDGRAFLERSNERYDRILLALPDSLTLVAGQSSLRLESYLFTAEAVAAARAHLRPDGVFTEYNFYRQQWLIDGSWDQAQTLGSALRDGITCREIYDLGKRFAVERAYGERDAVRQTWEEGGHFGHGYASGFDWPWLGVTGQLVDEPLRAPFAVTIELYWQEGGVGHGYTAGTGSPALGTRRGRKARGPGGPAPRPSRG